MITTKMRVTGARLLYRLATAAAGNGKKIIKRGGIKFEVDLAEGLDLSLYLFGSFQKHVTKNTWAKLCKDSTVIDVGANFGVMTLQFAQSCVNGKVIAFEPTHYALTRLRRNLQLNPELASRVEVIQSFVSDKCERQPELVAYASWRVDGVKTGREHPVHIGTPHSTEGIASVTLDDVIASRHLDRVDLIKIDVDGDELSVLRGARKTIARFKPVVIFEIGSYLLEERSISFADFAAYFAELDYSIFDTKTGRLVTAHNFYEITSPQATTDLAAVPR